MSKKQCYRFVLRSFDVKIRSAFVLREDSFVEKNSFLEKIRSSRTFVRREESSVENSFCEKIRSPFIEKNSFCEEIRPTQRIRSARRIRSVA